MVAMTQMRKRWAPVVAALGVMVLADLAPRAATAEEPTAATDSQPKATALLLQMADFLSRANKFSVELAASYEVVQKSGQKIEFDETGNVAVDRPNHLRAESEASDGARQLVVFDGKNISVEHEQTAFYAQTPQNGTIDDTIVHFVRDLQMRLPLAPLFMQTLPAELKRRVVTADYVELTNIFGVPAHHIAARTPTVDFQVWIAKAADPVPIRLVLNYPGAEGNPGFRAQFVRWDFAPKFANNTFSFVPVQGAEKIPFVSEVQNAAAGKSQPKTEGAPQ